MALSFLAQPQFTKLHNSSLTMTMLSIPFRSLMVFDNNGAPHILTEEDFQKILRDILNALEEFEYHFHECVCREDISRSLNAVIGNTVTSCHTI